MKHMKAKLFVTLVMLLVAATAMTSVSYAWFTVSTAPEVAGVEMTMKATVNLEIAKATDGTTAPSEVTSADAGTETCWGEKITGFTGATIDFPATLSSDNKLVTMKYDVNGRTNTADVATTAPTLASGFGYYTADIKQGDTTLLSGAKVAAVYGVWLRSNVANTVTPTCDPTAATDGSGNALSNRIKNSVKVAVLDPSSDAVTTSISLTANTAKLVYIVVYLEGEHSGTGDSEIGIIAADVASAITLKGLKVSFAGSATGSTFAEQHAAA